MTSETGRRWHDMGGDDAGPISQDEHDFALWEKRVDAMLVLLATKKHAFKIDAMRRVIESYGEQQYDATEYYEKWIRAIRNLIVEQELVSKDEIDAVLKAASEQELRGVLNVNDAPLVSIDFNHDPASSTYESPLTKVIDGKLVKVVSWYDNEWGFSNRMLDTTIALMNAA